MPLLGKLSPARFLRDYWQKRPLLIRGAFPNFKSIVDRNALFALAAREHVTSRLVLQARAKWQRHDGPLHIDPRQLPRTHWTLLVHGIESLVEGGWAILNQFDFIRAARVDDLMVSYAAPGGSVGPHDDRYDVFLLQAGGRRRWRLQHGGSRALDPNHAIKVLADFDPDEEHVLEPGDMLYLPPGVAHHGIAEEPGFTYSIGFLAPSERDLIQGFLGYLGYALPLDENALVEVADARPPRHRLSLDPELIDKTARVLGAIRWERALVDEFVGCFLTRPKPNAQFAPTRLLSLAAFARRRGRLQLALPSRGLVQGRKIFFNGEAHSATPRFLRSFKKMISERALTLPLDDEVERLHAWYSAGWLR